MGGLELPISKWDSLDSSLEAGSDLTSFDSKLLLEMASHENAAINFDSDAFCVNLPEFSTVLVGDFRPPEVASAMAYEAQTLPPAELDIPGNPLVGGPLERVATRFGLGPFRSTQRRENSSAPNDGGRDGGGGSKGSSASKTGSHSTSSESLPGKRPRRKASESGGKKRVTRKHPRGRVSSKFRGVTKHCHTGKFEAHLWNPNVERPQSCSRRKGKQVYLGQYHCEEKAARIYDRAALSQHRHKVAHLVKEGKISEVSEACGLNFSFQAKYQEAFAEILKVDHDEYISRLKKRKGVRVAESSEEGGSAYKGVTKVEYESNGCSGIKWLAQINTYHQGKKTTHDLGEFDTEREAAHAYDSAVIGMKEGKGITNFEKYTYFSE